MYSQPAAGFGTLVLSGVGVALCPLEFERVGAAQYSDAYLELIKQLLRIALKASVKHQSNFVVILISCGAGPRNSRDARRDGKPLDDLLNHELGYATSCLTEPEGARLLGCAGIDQIRASFDGARRA